MSLNDRPNEFAKAKQTAAIRREIYQLAMAARIPPQQRISVRLVWTVPDRIRRDDENPVATLKAVCDALAAPTRHRTGISPGALIVPDDTHEFMLKHMPVIEYRKGQAGVRIEIEAIPT